MDNEASEDRELWQQAMQLLRDSDRVAASLPAEAEERFGVASAMRRAAVSVVANIAAAQGRLFPAEFAHLERLARQPRPLSRDAIC